MGMIGGKIRVEVAIGDISLKHHGRETNLRQDTWMGSGKEMEVTELIGREKENSVGGRHRRVHVRI